MTNRILVAATCFYSPTSAGTPFTDSSGNVWLADQGFADGQTSPGVFNFGGGGRPGGFGGFGGRGGAGRSGAAYSSVIAIDFEGEQQFVQLTASSLVGVSAKDGKVLWQYAAPANGLGINCSTPIFQDGLVFAASRSHIRKLLTLGICGLFGGRTCAISLVPITWSTPESRVLRNQQSANRVTYAV